MPPAYRRSRRAGNLQPVGSSAGLADQPVILCMRANPHPVDPFLHVCSQGAVMISNTHRPQLAEALEVQGRVARV